MSRLALVTGATSGIGEATAIKLAQRGCELIITGRRQSRLEELKKKLQNLSQQKCTALVFDVSDRKEVQSVFAKHEELFSRVDYLINNAGLAKGVDPMPEADIEDWEIMIDTNIKGLLYMTRLILPGMIKRNSGDIVNLGSLAGRWVYPGGGVYCATKFAVRALTEGLRMDLLGTKIRVMTIEPGRVETEFSLVRMGDEAAAKKVYEGMNPLVAEDIAESIVWCLERPSHVNIQEMVIVPTDQASVTLFHKQLKQTVT